MSSAVLAFHNGARAPKHRSGGSRGHSRRHAPSHSAQSRRGPPQWSGSGQADAPGAPLRRARRFRSAPRSSGPSVRLGCMLARSNLRFHWKIIAWPPRAPVFAGMHVRRHHPKAHRQRGLCPPSSIAGSKAPCSDAGADAPLRQTHAILHACPEQGLQDRQQPISCARRMVMCV